MRVLTPCSLAGAVLIALWLLLIAPVAAQGPPPELIEEASAATVYIETQLVLAASDWNALSPELKAQMKNKRPQGPASGTGFLVNREGLIVTNAHVVSELRQTMEIGPQEQVEWRFIPSTFKVVVNSGLPNERTYQPKIIKVDEQVDLALLKIDAQPDIKPLVLNPLLPISAGQQVLMAGFPGGKVSDLAPFADHEEILKSEKNPRVSINLGTVTAVREQEKNVRYQLDVRANHGNSGGPILTPAGEVVGVLYAGIDGMQSINYAVPTWYLKRIMPANLLADWGPGFANAGGDSQDYGAFKDSGTFKLK